MKYFNKKEVIQKWKKRNGAADFDLKKRNIILYDGGLFAIEKKIKKRPRYKLIKIKEGEYTGCSELVPIKGKKIKYEDYKTYLWFEELNETINYLRRMKRMLNKLGYKTGFEKV